MRMNFVENRENIEVEVKGKMVKMPIMEEVVKHLYCEKCEEYTLLHCTRKKSKTEGECNIYIHPTLCCKLNDSPILIKPDIKIKFQKTTRGYEVFCPLCNRPLDRWSNRYKNYTFNYNEDKRVLGSEKIEGTTLKPTKRTHENLTLYGYILEIGEIFVRMYHLEDDIVPIDEFKDYVQSDLNERFGTKKKEE